MEEKKLFVLDTNVLIHDPSAIWQFEEHDIYIPMVVLEELDNLKKGTTEMARNVRHATHYLDELITNVTHAEIVQGIPLNKIPRLMNQTKTLGKLFFQTEQLETRMPISVSSHHKADNNILTVVISLKEIIKDRTVILVTKDINLRIKATVLGIEAEDYFNDQVVDSLEELRKGIYELPADFWEKHSKDLASWQETGRSLYKITGVDMSQWVSNDCVYLPGEQHFEAIVREVHEDHAILEFAKDYRNPKHSVWGIAARNLEQNFALNHLLNPEIDLVTIQGIAGTGKTLLALAAGLMQCIDQNIYREIIMTRVTVPLGEDIGFLPGTEEEKMTPWMGALLDNLDVLNDKQGNASEWEKNATNDLLQTRLKIRSMNFMRGRTFWKKYLIIDEAQNLTSKQLKTLITRAGPGTKMVILGDLQQIDTPYLNEVTSGFTYVIDRFKNCSYSAHVTLTHGERSRLADYAASVL